ncbi:MAG: hypothetical protein U9Q37_07600 [Euryarchaeota archaeon]|nr:hypothetical protein [Euryarchaeota archaeon]
MARPKGIIDAVCQNPQCHYYRKEAGKVIIKSDKYKNTGHQRYYCKHCETYFMGTKGTPLYWKHLSESEIINIRKHLVEKNGIRSIERITGHHRDTSNMEREFPIVFHASEQPGSSSIALSHALIDYSKLPILKMEIP